MIRRIDLRGRAANSAALDYSALVPRAPFDVEAAVEAVRPTLADVRHRGVDALRDYAARWDDVELTDIRVPKSALEQALRELDPDVRAAFEESIRRLRAVSEAELERDTEVRVVPGGTVTQRLVPFRRVGVYIPGGVAPLASSVVMNVVPAQVAGVESVALASSPQKEYGGLPHPTVLAVAELLGVDEVYAAGGVAAVAMFAYGVPAGVGADDSRLLCRPVDFVAGPGRITTTAAKRLVKGTVGIDSEAGPTEIAILADDSADPAYVAADLISQAEHDTVAASVLVTPSEDLAAAVEGELAHQVPATKHVQRITEALSGEQSGIVLVDDLKQGLAVVDAYAAEHLEIHTENARELAGRVRNAGAIFVGPWSPVSLGDYCAGSNHVLPTGGCACHSSGLSVRSYLKAVHVVDYDQAALREVAGHVTALAEAEDLPAHGQAVRARFGSAADGYA
ncbi:histidinol dehydrogenase [Actinopolymorpha singaporensis]|uniref:Histidinol dehydrogenase n=1 Tax=Actinopolymorpha singaporensis TaxID=117157 RepID=A0A1H1X3R2_9ACTN|nr:histidinol dehydrogenase [Actinopolymorpha singaporensis]